MVGVCDVFLAGCQVFLSCVLVGYLCRLWGGRSCAGLLPDALVWLMMVYCRVEWGSCACMACVCFEVAARGVILMRRVRCRILRYLYGWLRV